MKPAGAQALLRISSPALCCFCVATLGWSGQAAPPLPEIRTLYIASFGDNNGARSLRESLVRKLRSNPKLSIVDNPGQADAVIGGSGEIWVKGYYSLNPRIRFNTHDAHPVYGGYLSVELKDRNKETIWSYLATPPSGSEDAAGNMTSQMAKRLAAFLEGRSRTASSR